MSEKKKQAPNAKVDGRVLRSERSRQAIIDAMLVLVNEGNLVPTAQQVSERANVGIRSVFRHFSDMESLFVTTDSQLRTAYEAIFTGGDRDGTLAERVQHAIARHAAGYEAQKLIILSTHSQMWRSQVLRKNYARSQRGLRKDLDDWLPELRKLPVMRREAVDAAASFETWHRLREHQNLSRKASIAVVVEMLTLLIGEN